MAGQMTDQDIEVLDPVGDPSVGRLRLVPRLRDLRGARLGVLDTQWRGFTQLLGKLVPELREQFELSDVVMRTGVTGDPTEERVLAELSRTDAVLNGLCN
ncbi:MAG: hypothetical protein HY684_02660 [Chloroflexi bacterium]|nr:hypothetical protein [Chloroflexota bacterium]